MFLVIVVIWRVLVLLLNMLLFVSVICDRFCVDLLQVFFVYMVEYVCFGRVSWEVVIVDVEFVIDDMFGQILKWMCGQCLEQQLGKIDVNDIFLLLFVICMLCRQVMFFSLEEYIEYFFCVVQCQVQIVIFVNGMLLVVRFMICSLNVSGMFFVVVLLLMDEWMFCCMILEFFRMLGLFDLFLGYGFVVLFGILVVVFDVFLEVFLVDVVVGFVDFLDVVGVYVVRMMVLRLRLVSLSRLWWFIRVWMLKVVFWLMIFLFVWLSRCFLYVGLLGVWIGFGMFMSGFFLFVWSG